MKQSLKNLLTGIIMIFGLYSLQAQETTSATGGEASGGGGTASYTVGQLVYTTQIGTTGSAAQGVQQPFEISIVTGIDEAQGISLLVKAFPNPTTDCLTLEIDGEVQTQYIASLYDMQGKLQRSINITADKIKINTTDLPAGTYFLKISDNKKEIKSFKIIKNN